MRSLTTAPPRCDPDHLDGVVSKQVDLPPRRSLPLRLRASFAVMFCGPLAIIAVGSWSTTHRGGLVGRLAECNVCAWGYKWSMVSTLKGIMIYEHVWTIFCLLRGNYRFISNCFHTEVFILLVVLLK